MARTRKHLDIKIWGSVQGVFFRYSAKKEAEKLDIAGFARNEPDGAVLVEAEGEEETLVKFLAWCRKGPPLARVEGLEVKEGELRGHRDFSLE